MHIITHGDCDGICAGAIALYSNKGARVIFSNPVKLCTTLNNISKDEDLIICDVAINKSTFNEIIQTLNSFSSHILYIDHHPMPQNIESKVNRNLTLIKSEDQCASELTYVFFEKTLPVDMSRVAIYGAIGDYQDNTVIIGSLLENWDKRTLYFQTGVLVQALEDIGRNDDIKIRILQELSDNVPPSGIDSLLEHAIIAFRREEEMRNSIEKNVTIVGNIGYILQPDGPLGKAAVYARAYAKAVVGVAGEIRQGLVEMSLRTASNVDLDRNLNKIAPTFGGLGGGHEMAAGAQVPYDKFYDFVSALNSEVSRATLVPRS
jgi:single-stranded-DNA-specific exonuclease